MSLTRCIFIFVLESVVAPSGGCYGAPSMMMITLNRFRALVCASTRVKIEFLHFCPVVGVLASIYSTPLKVRDKAPRFSTHGPSPIIWSSAVALRQDLAGKSMLQDRTGFHPLQTCICLLAKKDLLEEPGHNPSKNM